MRDLAQLPHTSNLRVRLLPGKRSAVEVDANDVGRIAELLPQLAPVLATIGFEALEARPFATGSVSGFSNS